ncbi:basic salivary proline-rich protein 4-like [Phasianus colchicus]|uniref:basic salivary proline-rich protein 4-like n=1 Tax=Phasianus colchicus TaxID=9054 RepID=UPI00129DD522|nr:basic salivary proline-rich protein 4-like [Phasianus colchicus]
MGERRLPGTSRCGAQRPRLHPPRSGSTKRGQPKPPLSLRLRGAAEHTKAAPRPRGAQPSPSPHLPLAAQRARAGRSGPPVHPGLPAGGGRASGSAVAAARGSGRAGEAAAPLPPGPSQLYLASLRPAPSRARQWRIAAASGGRRRRRPPRRAAHPAAPRPFIWDLRRGEEEEEEKKEEAAVGWVSPLTGVSAISPLHGKRRGGESRHGRRQRGVPTGAATAPRGLTTRSRRPAPLPRHLLSPCAGGKAQPRPLPLFS